MFGMDTRNESMAQRTWRRLPRQGVVVVAIAFCQLASPTFAAGVAPRLVSKTLFIQSPLADSAVWSSTFYTQGQGQELMTVMSNDHGQSDSSYDGQYRRSSDNGKTWSAWNPYADKFASPGWVDTSNGRLLEMVHMNVGTPQSVMRYRVSNDGGRTFPVDQQVIQSGYTASNPVAGVRIGKNEMYIGAISCVPIRLQNQPASRQGRVLVPVQINPLGSDGELYHPGAMPDWYESAVLVGTWTTGMKLNWQLSQPVTGDPAKTTRGVFEPTVTELPDGRILMVSRGANDRDTSLPGYKWYSTSIDGGLHWSAASPWTYSDGSTLYSSSSCSLLIRHSSGRCYWIGNISPDNPSGSAPRYPLVIGQVDPTSLMLLKDSVTVIDNKGPGDGGSLQLSNFLAYEDRVSHEIVVDCTRFMSSPWQGDAYRYRISVLPEPSSVGLLLSTAPGLLAYAWHKRSAIRIDLFGAR
jgi:hypothetical protein